MEIKCLGAPLLSMFMGISTLIILAAMGIGFILILNFASVLTGLLLFSLSVFVFGRQIKNVIFKNDYIEINYYFLRKTKRISYKDCKKMYETNDGLLPAPVYIIMYSKNNNEKKITFACEETKLHIICDSYFNGFRPQVR